MTAFETVLYETYDNVSLIRFNRPDRRNAFNAALRRDFGIAVRQALDDSQTRIVVLTGAGHSFSAGADLSEEFGAGFLVERQLEDEYKPVLLAISTAPKPFISAVNGAAAGIGSAVAMACDLTVMAQDAYYLQAFTNIGLIPDGGATWQLLHQIGRKRAFEFIATGERVPAQRCLELGLVNRVVPPERLHDEAMEWARALAGRAPLALRYAKQALGAVAQGMDLADCISNEAQLQKLAVASADFAEGRQAFMQKRKPRFTGT